jgi:hypothetical protein
MIFKSRPLCQGIKNPFSRRNGFLYQVEGSGSTYWKALGAVHLTFTFGPSLSLVTVNPCGTRLR